MAHQEFEQLPKISRQVDTDTYLTAEGDRVSIREYEEKKAAIEEGPALTDADGLVKVRNAETEKETTGNTTEDGIKAENHPSATVDVKGVPGARRNNPDVANEGEIEDPEANLSDEKRARQLHESTPAVTVSNTGTSIEDQSGENKSYETVAADTNHVFVPKGVTPKVKDLDAVKNNLTSQAAGDVHPVAESPRETAKGVEKVEDAKVVKPVGQESPKEGEVKYDNSANDAVKNAEAKADVQ